ncbi:MAG: C25 family cysteine peptidase [Planctomycetota bacterium]
MIGRWLTARFVLALLATYCVLTGSASAEVVAIVCPPELRRCFDDWTRHRAADGRRFVFINSDDCERRLRQLASEGDVTLLLVGERSAAAVPPRSIPARVIHRYGPETTIASDRRYAELSNATRVGRLPFDDESALRHYLSRVIERDLANSSWGDTRLQIAAGVGGFSPFIDAAIERAAKSVVQRLASPASDISLTRYGNHLGTATSTPTSSRGGVWVWMGHGLRSRLPGVPLGRVVEVSRGADLAVLLACYAGDFTERGHCVAEQLLSSKDGPLAVIASTRVSMPYGNARLGAELLALHADAPGGTPIGELFVAAQGAALEEATTPALTGLDPLARLVGPTTHSLRDERLDHAAMYHLLGDPLLPAKRYDHWDIEFPSQLTKEEDLTLRGLAPTSGRLHVEVSRPGRSTAVDRVDEVRIDAGDHFAIHLAPDDAWTRGTRVVRVGLESEQGLLLAAAKVKRVRSSEVPRIARETSRSEAR